MKLGRLLRYFYWPCALCGRRSPTGPIGRCWNRVFEEGTTRPYAHYCRICLTPTKGTD